MYDVNINFTTKDRTPPTQAVIDEAVSLLQGFIKNALKQIFEDTRECPVPMVVIKQELDGTPFMIRAHLDYEKQFIGRVLVQEVDPVVLNTNVPFAASNLN